MVPTQTERGFGIKLVWKLASVTELSYFKEFLDPMVRSIIDRLPFTSEGYNRVKSILEGKYGKPSKIVNAHFKAL